MKNLVTPKTSMVSRPSTDDTYFFVENIIVPIKKVDVLPELIDDDQKKNTEIISSDEIQRVAKENIGNTILDKFFYRVSDYVDRLEEFLNKLKKLQHKYINQKVDNYHRNKTDQFLRTRESRKIVKDTQESEEKNKPINLKNVPELSEGIATALGLTAANVISSPFMGGQQVYSEVVSQGDFAVDTSGEQTQRIPAWIPFPKGTSGLTFTSGFGYQNWRGYEHGGIDIAGPVGTPIITPISGVVAVSGWDDGGYGNWVVVKSGSTEMIFGHMYQTPPVSVGQQIQAGTVVGGIGSTGRSTGPHLHWTITENGVKVDPAIWTQQNRPQTSTSTNIKEGEQKTLDPESEGGLNRSKRRIMVGEAGIEFVVPISQMPAFSKAMIDEKIKTFVPWYDTKCYDDDLGVPSRAIGGISAKFSAGGIAEGIKWIKEEEGLSSLSPGKNVWIKPSDPKFRNIKDTTKLYTYETGVAGDRTTIGWGFTFFDEITSGKVPVRPGMTMTKREADRILEKQVRHYHDNFLIKEIPWFNNFTPQQQAGVILYGFNQPYGPIGSAPKLTAALKSGNLKAAAAQVGRGLPEREKIERRLLLSGPDRIVGNAIVGPKKVGSGIPFIPPIFYKPEIKVNPPTKPQKISELNNIDGGLQHEIAYQTQSKYDIIENDLNISNSIVAVQYHIIDKTTNGISVG